MSDHAARTALSRMNLREVAVAAHYSGLANDLTALARADNASANAEFLSRRGDLCAAFGMNEKEQRKPFAFAGGVAIIPVSGTLINRFGGSYSFVTGYNFVRSQLNHALADEDVKGIILDVNSYGGEAGGCFELADEIRAAREQKPILAIVDSNAYSAGYAIASAASKVVATPSGGVGSIGVISMHVDMSKMLEDAGIKITLIYESEHKADGNPFEPLPDDVKAEIQASIHKSYETFVALVASNRGMDVAKVRDTKSRSYRADDALSLGLIDAIASPIKAASAFLTELSGSTFQLRQGAQSMTTAHNEPGTQTEAHSDKAAIEKAAADARAAERARVAGIVGCEEAKGRSALANHFAMNTDMSVEQARAALAVAPQESAGKPQGNPFEAAMNAGQHPNVGADTQPGTQAEEDSPVARILASHAAATGLKSVKAA
jgi:capsid assembly protease